MTAAKPLTGRAVLLMVLAFFAVIIGVNVLMTTLAIETFDGLDQQDAYRKGRDYNQVLAEQRAEAALGWSTQITSRIADPARRTVELTLSVAGARGGAVLGLVIEGTLKRPTNAALDTPIAFTPLGAGRYRAQVTLPAWGRWSLAVSAREGSAHARIAQDLLIAP